MYTYAQVSVFLCGRCVVYPECIVHCTTIFGQKLLCKKGATVWNSLLNKYRAAHAFLTFKVKLKTMLA